MAGPNRYEGSRKESLLLPPVALHQQGRVRVDILPEARPDALLKQQTNVRPQLGESLGIGRAHERRVHSKAQGGEGIVVDGDGIRTPPQTGGAGVCMHKVCEELQRRVPVLERPQPVAVPVRLAEEADVVRLREVASPVVLFVARGWRARAATHRRGLCAQVHGSRASPREVALARPWETRWCRAVRSACASGWMVEQQAVPSPQAPVRTSVERTRASVPGAFALHLFPASSGDRIWRDAGAPGRRHRSWHIATTCHGDEDEDRRRVATPAALPSPAFRMHRPSTAQ